MFYNPTLTLMAVARRPPTTHHTDRWRLHCALDELSAVRPSQLQNPRDLPTDNLRALLLSQYICYSKRTNSG